jgi:hypothetical protein
MVAVMDSGGITAGQGSGEAGQAMAGMDMSAGGGVATMSLAGTGRKLTAAVPAFVLLAFTLRWPCSSCGSEPSRSAGSE